ASGTYNDELGGSVCKSCLPGYYCLAGSTIYKDKLCPAGHYCPSGTKTANEFKCPKGTYRPDKMGRSVNDCIPCLASQYCPNTGSIAPSACCAAGYYCSHGSDTDKPINVVLIPPSPTSCVSHNGNQCPIGYFCEICSAAPKPCSPGKYCETKGLSQVTGNCVAGYYCISGAKTKTPTDGATGDICPKGHYCPLGTAANAKKCPIGTLSATTGNIKLSDCLSCPAGQYCAAPGLSIVSGDCSAGYYCPSGSDVSTKTMCPLGYYCPVKSSDKIGCAIGFYQDLLGQPLCKVCPPGMYSDAIKSISCKVCPETFYCIDGKTKVICPAGKYCLSGSGLILPLCPIGTFSLSTGLKDYTECTPCSSGKYCATAGLTTVTGDCNAGFYCTTGVNVPNPDFKSNMGIGGPCTLGHYCPKTSSVPTKCIAGTYNDEVNKSVCKDCPAGYACPLGSDNYFSKPCNKGYYCPTKSTTQSQIACPKTKYNPNKGGKSLNDCLDCPDGKYCDTLALISVTKNCNAGYFCRLGVDAGDCTIGYYCPTGSYQKSECSPGQHCSTTKLAAPTSDCPAGYHCESKNILGTEKKCSVGHYCLIGSIVETPCPEGTFSNNIQNSKLIDCTSCTTGKFCAGLGNTNPTGKCAAGYYCPTGQSNPTPITYICPKGFYCLEGASEPIACVSGTYQPSTGNVSCLDCPDGYYCKTTLDLNGKTVGVDIPVACPAGSYCPSKTTSAAEFLCPIGTYSIKTKLVSSHLCDLCAAGKYCSTQGLSSATGDCTKGYYCISGAKTPSTVDFNTVIKCEVGYYCPLGAQNPILCPKGSYCEIKSSVDTKCPSGTYNRLTGSVTLSECLKCPNGKYCQSVGLKNVEGDCSTGYYCKSGAKSSQPTDGVTGGKCQDGYYCPAGTKTQLICKEGTYSVGIGASTCIDCEAGFYCVGGNNKVVCPKGKYCLSKSLINLPNCPIGKFGASTGLKLIGDCTACTAGSYCETSGLITPTGKCAKGYYCPAGSSKPNPSTFCNKGEFCIEGSVTPLKCVSGKYINIQKSDKCLDCPSGYFCLNAATDYQSNTCPVGYYCPSGTKISTQFPCPIGTFNDKTTRKSTDSCKKCTGGNYCNAIGINKPTGPCLGGYYCKTTATSKNPSSDICLKSTYCPAGSVLPLQCKPGSYCALDGLLLPTALCDAGYFCPFGMVKANAVSSACPAGQYCKKGSITPILCPRGTFLSTTTNDVITKCTKCTAGSYCFGTGLTAVTALCTAGYYCPEGRKVGNNKIYICPAGFKCPTGSSNKLFCVSGTFQPYTGKSSCEPCIAGKYCPQPTTTTGCTNPLDCPAGYYCPIGTSSVNENPCPLGTFSSVKNIKTAGECQSCLPGKYCDAIGKISVVGPCSAGYICISGAKSSKPTDGTTGVICPKGHYCPAGSSRGIKCPTGTYSSQTGLKLVTECTDCDSGKYCMKMGLISPEGNCSPSHWCKTKSTYATPRSENFGILCPIGQYCVSGIPINCPKGSYMKVTGAKSLSECTACTPGSYCETVGLSVVTGSCIAGYYCKLGATTKTPIDGVTGNKCTIGSYCPTESNTPIECMDGSYAPSIGLTICTTCPLGKSCTKKISADDCKAGHYCPIGTGYNTEPCPSGTFSSIKGQGKSADCTQCTAGSYCEENGLTAVSGKCTVGYFCTIGLNVAHPDISISFVGTGGICPIGQFCKLGSSLPTNCLAGTYQLDTGNGDCIDCPVGFFCTIGSSSPEICPVGHYCISKTISKNQYPCPVSTYNSDSGATTSTNCLKCLSGYYCAGVGNVQPTGKCQSGYYCISSVKIGAPLNILTDGNGGKCTKGNFCPSGSIKESPCVTGKYCPSVGLDETSMAIFKCKAGYYCPTGSSIENPKICPKAHYCLIESPLPLPCPIGTFSNMKGLQAKSDCSPCTPGMYCETVGLTAPTGACASGYFCTGSDTSKNPILSKCPVGYQCPLQSSSKNKCVAGQYQSQIGQGNCLSCPMGYYCDPLLLTDKTVVSPIICPKGYFCPTGTNKYSSNSCPIGTYGIRTGLNSDTHCTYCKYKSYCDVVALSLVSKVCFDGYYCEGGAQTSKPNTVITLTGGIYSPGKFHNKICPKGYYCKGGIKQSCPIGTYLDKTGSILVSDCIACPGGKYCSHQGISVISSLPNCKAGYYCPSGSPKPNPLDLTKGGNLCTIGHYCPEGSSVPLECATGTFSQVVGKILCDVCPKGYYCDVKKMSSPKICPVGSYCTSGSISPKLCPKGTYSDKTGLYDVVACRYCDIGYFCPNEGESQVVSKCIVGYFCEGGALTDMGQFIGPFTRNGLCDYGHYCTLGTIKPTPCPMGTFRNILGGKTVADCIKCTAGSYCATTGLQNPTGLCYRGYYCSGVTGATLPNPTASICPAKSYCVAGSVSPKTCKIGEYQPLKGQWECFICPKRFYCLSGEKPIPCLSFHYCPKGSSNPIPCPDGTYTDLKTTKLGAASECPVCPNSVYCINGKTVGPCEAGYFCSSGASSSTPTDLSIDFKNCATSLNCAGPCPLGYYCKYGANEPTPCPKHTYAFRRGSKVVDECEPCPIGYMCEPHKPPQICDKGFYCPEGQGRQPCLKYTYRNSYGGQTIHDCFPCLAGHWCNRNGMSDISKNLCPINHFCHWCNRNGMSDISKNLCPINHFCLEGKDKQGCLPGTMRTSRGAKSALECEKCLSGHYCANNATTRMAPCGERMACPIGTDKPNCCQEGRYCLERSDVGFVCPGGYWCPACTGSKLNLCEYPQLCERGSWKPRYCPIGYRAILQSNRSSIASSCEECNYGTYSNNDRTECLLCTAGYYCVEGEKIKCPVGHYCPEASENPTACLPGEYNKFTTKSRKTDCTKCPVNYFSFGAAVTCIYCGKSATSKSGDEICTCIGKNRIYQASDGSCKCKGGYIFYNQFDKTTSEFDSSRDCQLIVDANCKIGECRSPINRSCINVGSQNCATFCASQSAYFDSEQCRCICPLKVDICDNDCALSLPVMTVVKAISGKFCIEFKATDKPTDVFTEMNIFVGTRSTSYLKSTPKIKIQYCSLISTSLVCFNVNSFSEMNNIYTMGLKIPPQAVRQPIVCLQRGEGIVFSIKQNVTSSKVYLMYNRNHLYNTDLNYDYGDFVELKNVFNQEKNVMNGFFVVFNNPGVYVIHNSKIIESQVIINVKNKDVLCEIPRVKPLTKTVITSSRIEKFDVKNQEPNINIIIGIISIFCAFILLIILIIFITKPIDSNIYPMKHWIPYYRNLGYPPSIRKYLKHKCDSFEKDTLEISGGTLLNGCTLEKSELDKYSLLKNFNMKLFYNKLTDQKTILSNQLDKMEKNQMDKLNQFSVESDELFVLFEKLINMNNFKSNKERVTKTKNKLKNYDQIIENIFDKMENFDTANKNADTCIETDIISLLRMLIKSILSGKVNISNLDINNTIFANISNTNVVNVGKNDEIKYDSIYKKYESEIHSILLDYIKFMDNLINENQIKMKKSVGDIVKEYNFDQYNYTNLTKLINRLLIQITKESNQFQSAFSKSTVNFISNVKIQYRIGNDVLESIVKNYLTGQLHLLTVVYYNIKYSTFQYYDNASCKTLNDMTVSNVQELNDYLVKHIQNYDQASYETTVKSNQDAVKTIKYQESLIYSNLKLSLLKLHNIDATVFSFDKFAVESCKNILEYDRDIINCLNLNIFQKNIVKFSHNDHIHSLRNCLQVKKELIHKMELSRYDNCLLIHSQFIEKIDETKLECYVMHHENSLNDYKYNVQNNDYENENNYKHILSGERKILIQNILANFKKYFDIYIKVVEFKQNSVMLEMKKRIFKIPILTIKFSNTMNDIEKIFNQRTTEITNILSKIVLKNMNEEKTKTKNDWGALIEETTNLHHSIVNCDVKDINNIEKIIRNYESISNYNIISSELEEKCAYTIETATLQLRRDSLVNCTHLCICEKVVYSQIKSNLKNLEIKQEEFLVVLNSFEENGKQNVKYIVHYIAQERHVNEWLLLEDHMALYTHYWETLKFEKIQKMIDKNPMLEINQIDKNVKNLIKIVFAINKNVLLNQQLKDIIDLILVTSPGCNVDDYKTYITENERKLDNYRNYYADLIKLPYINDNLITFNYILMDSIIFYDKLNNNDENFKSAVSDVKISTQNEIKLLESVNVYNFEVEDPRIDEICHNKIYALINLSNDQFEHETNSAIEMKEDIQGFDENENEHKNIMKNETPNQIQNDGKNKDDMDSILSHETDKIKETDSIRENKNSGKTFVQKSENFEKELDKNSVFLSQDNLYRLIKHSPIWLQLENIERKMKNMNISSTLNNKDVDLDISNDILLETDMAELNLKTFIVYKFGVYLADELFNKLSMKHVNISLAEKVDFNMEHVNMNSMCQYFSYNKQKNILYIKQSICDNVGKFIVVLINGLSFITCQQFNLQFESVFYNCVEFIGEHIYFFRENIFISWIIEQYCENQTHKSHIFDNYCIDELFIKNKHNLPLLLSNSISHRITYYKNILTNGNVVDGIKSKDIQYTVERVLDFSTLESNKEIEKLDKKVNFDAFVGQANWQSFINEQDCKYTVMYKEKDAKQQNDMDDYLYYLYEKIAEQFIAFEKNGECQGSLINQQKKKSIQQRIQIYTLEIESLEKKNFYDKDGNNTELNNLEKIVDTDETIPTKKNKISTGSRSTISTKLNSKKRKKLN
ncbi:hypothetical protein A3Q56_02216, partial [Intoshia linei]